MAAIGELNFYVNMWKKSSQVECPEHFGSLHKLINEKDNKRGWMYQIS